MGEFVLSGKAQQPSKLTGRIAPVAGLSGRIAPIAGMSGTLTVGDITINDKTLPYEGVYEITPGETEQQLPTEGLKMLGNVVIRPVPGNYGRITWDGGILTVS